jgi:acetylserotonin N-methyltransferase
LGGGSGHLAEAARERYPHLQTVVFDLPAVARLYPGTIAGDFFKDSLPEADLYSLGRILHDWSEEKIRALLARRMFAAWPSALLVLTRQDGDDRGGSDRHTGTVAERLLDQHNIPAHMQSLNMLIATEGRERTAAEYQALLKAAGFSKFDSRCTGAPLDAILAIK